MSGGPRLRRIAGFAVHVLTLSGAVLALAAMAAAVERDWVLCFALLGMAMIVDGIDGPLARGLDLPGLLPRWRGDVLDQIVDYLTYVFVPAWILFRAGLVPDGLGLAVAGLICVTAGFHFADRRNKTEDQFFLGFPAVWNVVVFYLFVFPVPPIAALGIVVVCAAATFLPVAFVHPLRVRRLRKVTLAFTVLWSAAAIAALLQGLRPGPAVSLGLAVPAIYFLGLSVLRAIAHRGR